MEKEDLDALEKKALQYINHEWFDAHARVVLDLVKEIRWQWKLFQIIHDAPSQKSAQSAELKFAIYGYLKPLNIPLGDLKAIMDLLNVSEVIYNRVSSMFESEVKAKQNLQEDFEHLQKQYNETEKLYVDLIQSHGGLLKKFAVAEETIKWLNGASLESIRKDPTIVRRVTDSAFIKMA